MGGSYHFDKKGRRWFVSVYWQGKHHRIFRYNGDPIWSEKTAEKLLSKIRAEIDQGTFQPKSYFPQSPLSVSQYSQQWLKVINVKSNTLKDYSYSVRCFINPFFGDKDIRHIRNADLVEFYKWISRGDKGKYNVMSCLRTMLRSAWRNEDITRVPPFPRLTMGVLPEIRYYTLEQQDKVLTAIPEAHRGIFAFGMEFGVRIGELRALQWDCIEGNEVTIKRAFAENKLEESTKTGKRRYFELTPYAQEILKTLPLTSSTFIFVREDGKPYTDKNLNEIWRAACESAKVEHIPLKNAIRHSLGCQLLDEGVDIGIVQDIYGHSKMEMTKRYAKRTKARVTEALVKRRATVYLLNDTKREST